MLRSEVVADLVRHQDRHQGRVAEVLRNAVAIARTDRAKVCHTDDIPFHVGAREEVSDVSVSPHFVLAVVVQELPEKGARVRRAVVVEEADVDVEIDDAKRDPQLALIDPVDRVDDRFDPLGGLAPELQVPLVITFCS